MKRTINSVHSFKGMESVSTEVLDMDCLGSVAIFTCFLLILLFWQLWRDYVGGLRLGMPF